MIQLEAVILFKINHPAVFPIIKFPTSNLKSAVTMTHLWRFHHLKSLYLCLDISLRCKNFKTILILYIFEDNFSNKTLKLYETILFTDFYYQNTYKYFRFKPINSIDQS